MQNLFLLLTLLTGVCGRNIPPHFVRRASSSPTISSSATPHAALTAPAISPIKTPSTSTTVSGPTILVVTPVAQSNSATGLSFITQSSYSYSGPCNLVNPDPDQDIKGRYCSCPGTTLPLITNTNAPDQYASCAYWSSSWPTSTSTSSTSLSKGEIVGYPYTYTNALSDVIACETSTPYRAATYTLHECAGANTTISYGPRLTLEIGSATQNVGTLTGDALFTSISNAISTICASPTTTTAAATGVDSAAATESVVCGTDTVVIGDIVYLAEGDVGTLEGTGELTVSVESSKLVPSDPSILEAMIIMVASLANTSASGDSCWKGMREVGGEGFYSVEDVTLCNSAGFGGVQYLQNGTLTAWLDVTWKFSSGSFGAIACPMAMGVMDSLEPFEEMFPFMSLLALIGESATTFVCAGNQLIVNGETPT